jgi:CheY-like chemotaxis protein
MSEDVRLRAFEPFFTTKELGTGLGLSTCYGIVEQLGGHLALASEPGAGTEASVFLPRAEGEGQAASVAPPGPAEGGEVILVVEDEPAVRSMTARGLRKHGYTVIEATHGADALACLRDGPLAVDVLVTDVVMPEMSGCQLAERALALSPTTRVLFVSGHADAVVERHGVRGLEGAFLQKPYTPATLAQRIRELLGGEPRGAGRRPGSRGGDRA